MWNASPEPEVAGYVILYGTQSGFYTDIVDVGNRTSWPFDLPGLHYFAVQAYTTLGASSALSNEVNDSSDSFTYTISDGQGATAVALVTVKVTPVNDAPVATDQAVVTDEDTAKAITLGVTDPDSTTFTYTIGTPPAHGTLSGSAPRLTYTPALNYNGPDRFTYKVNDGTLDSNVATVSITVTAVDDPPAAIDQAVVAQEDTAQAITPGGTEPHSTTFPHTTRTPP